jgi:hypothetical protein
LHIIDSPAPAILDDEESVTESDSDWVEPSTPLEDNDDDDKKEASNSENAVVKIIDSPAPATLNNEESTTESDPDWVEPSTLLEVDDEDAVGKSVTDGVNPQKRKREESTPDISCKKHKVS